MSYWRLYYHIIWATKNREPLLKTEWEQKLYRYLWGKATALGLLPHAINGMPDHIHLFISIPPKQSISKMVGHLKGSSSRYINRELDPLGFFEWQSGFGVLSVSERRKSVLVQYIKNQKQHHVDGTSVRILEKMD
jgi:putative transposase